MKFYYILLFIPLSFCLTASGKDFQLSAKMKGFIEKYCYDCHGDGADKGGLDFDKLSRNLTDKSTLAKWVDIYDRVFTGDMPPKKKEKTSGLRGYPTLLQRTVSTPN